MNLSQNKIRLAQLFQNNRIKRYKFSLKKNRLGTIKMRHHYLPIQIINYLFLLTQNNNKKRGSLPSCIIKIISKIKDYSGGETVD